MKRYAIYTGLWKIQDNNDSFSYLFVLFQWAVQGLGCEHAIGRILQKGDG